jgi:hypothetical protein
VTSSGVELVVASISGSSSLGLRAGSHGGKSSGVKIHLEFNRFLGLETCDFDSAGSFFTDSFCVGDLWISGVVIDVSLQSCS